MGNGGHILTPVRHDVDDDEGNKWLVSKWSEEPLLFGILARTDRKREIERAK